MSWRRFSAIEVLCIAVLAVLVGKEWGLRKAPRPVLQGPAVIEDTSLESLQARFGPGRYSHGPEEWIVRDFFHDERNGVFV